MSFHPKNIKGYMFTTVIGVVLGISVGVVLFILVYLDKATIEGITPFGMAVVPVVITFLLHGPKGENGASGGASPQ